MIQVNQNITIERKPEEVFAYLADLTRLAEWQQGVVQTKVTTPGAVRLGTRFEETAKVGPWRLESKCEVTGFEPPRRMRFTATGKQLAYDGEFALTPDGAGTRLEATAHVQLRGFWRLMEPLMASDFKRETRQELQAIRGRLEGPMGEAPATA